MQLHLMLLLFIFGTLHSATVNRRIYGGEKAQAAEFPFMAKVLKELPDGRRSFCGGSLLNEDYVVTAAHCLDGEVTKAFVILGSEFSSDNGTDQQHFVIDKSALTLHPDYTSNPTTNDIALIKLPNKAVFNDRVQPISLPTRSEQNETFAGELGTIQGFGKTENNNGHELLWLKESIMPNNECAKHYRKILSSHICVTGEFDKVTCSGDSGSALTVGSGTSLRLVGVVSFGAAGCNYSAPSVEERVTSHFDWIEKNSNIVIS